MRPKRIRINKTTKLPVRNSLDFMSKLIELGYNKKQALSKYKFINAKCEGKLQFR